MQQSFSIYLIRKEEDEANARLGKRQRNDKIVEKDTPVSTIQQPKCNSGNHQEISTTHRDTTRGSQSGNTLGKIKVYIIRPSNFYSSFHSNFFIPIFAYLKTTDLHTHLDNSKFTLFCKKMKIMSWNVNGFGNSTTRNHLQMLIRSHNLDVIFLSETKISLRERNTLLLGLNFLK